MDATSVAELSEIHHRDVRCIAPKTMPAASGAAIAASTPTKLRGQVAAASNGGVSSAASATKMVALRTNVLDALSLLETQNEDSLLRMQAVHRRVNDANRDALQQLITFDDEFVYTNTVGFAVPRVIKEAKLRHSVEWLQSFGLPITTPKPEVYDAHLRALDAKLLDQPPEDAVAALRSSVTRPLFPFGDRSVPEMLVDTNLFAKADILGSARAKLTAVNEQIAAVDARIAEAERALASAEAQERLDTVETLRGEIVDLNVERCELVAKKLRLLTTGDSTGGNGGGGGLLAKLDKIVRSAAIPDLKSDKRELLNVTMSDIALLEADRVTKLKENDAAISKYNHWVATSRRQLQDNFREQDEVWQQLEALLVRLGGLGGAAREMMTKHMEVTEIEQKRRQEHREYRESYATHRQVLDDLVSSCNAASDFLDKAHDFVAENRKRVESMQIEATLQRMVESEKRAFDAAYLAFGRAATELLGKYESRLVGLETMVAELGFQRTQAFAVEDVGAPEYGKTAHAFEQSARLVRKKREKRVEQIEAMERLFIDMDSAIEATGDEDGEGASMARSSAGDASPAVQVRTAMAQRKDGAISRVAAFVESQVAVVENERATVVNLSEAIAAEREHSVARKSRETAVGVHQD